MIAAGFDVLTTRETDRRSFTDEEQLQFATEGNRAILSHNIRDFQRLARAWAAEGKHHCGIMFSAQRPPAAVTKMIADACQLYQDLSDIVIWLPVAP